MMKTIPYEKVLEIYKRLIRESGSVCGVRDKGLLKASLENAFQTFDGIELYPTDFDKIAEVCYNIKPCRRWKLLAYILLKQLPFGSLPNKVCNIKKQIGG